MSSFERQGYTQPKPLTTIGGRPLIHLVLENIGRLLVPLAALTSIQAFRVRISTSLSSSWFVGSSTRALRSRICHSTFPLSVSVSLTSTFLNHRFCVNNSPPSRYHRVSSRCAKTFRSCSLRARRRGLCARLCVPNNLSTTTPLFLSVKGNGCVIDCHPPSPCSQQQSIHRLEPRHFLQKD